MLARHSRIESVVPRISAVRAAAAEFVRGTTFGWGRRELAAWLVCHYSPCLLLDATAAAPKVAAKTSSHFAIATTRLDDEDVERLVLGARSKILRLLTALGWPSHAQQIAQRAIRTGAVLEYGERPDGDTHWLPVGKPKMLLAERVASLFVADYLEAPEAYRELSLCRGCGALDFGGLVTHDVLCAPAHRSRPALRVA